MRRTSLIAAVLAGIVCSAGQSTADSPAERETHWHEDLQFLLSKFAARGTAVDLKRGISSRGQKDYDKLYPHLAPDLTELEGEVTRLSDAEIVLRLMRLIAAPNVAHNGVEMPVGTGFFARLPLEFRWFSDGLAVVAASEDYATALGTHVRQIGNKTPEEVLAALSPYIPHENEGWLRFMSTGFMRPRILLEQAGATDANGEVVLTLQKPGSAPFSLTVKAQDSRVKRATLQEVLEPPVPLYRGQPGRLYWHRYLEDSATLFIQYNACANDPKLPFSEFSKAVMADADAHPVKRVVVDLRANGGGDSRIINPLLSGLEQRRNRLGPVYVLIGANTFSSGADNAEELRRSLHATLAGEPTGGQTIELRRG